MRIASINIRGMKAADRSLELGALNLLIGPVGSGKSTILDAIRFLALGYVPALGRVGSDTMRLSRPMRAIDVSAVCDDGTNLMRNLRCPDGRTTATANPSDEKVRAYFGATWTEAEQHLDLRELLGATANKRAEAIQTLLDSGSARDEEAGALAYALAGLRLLEIGSDCVGGAYPSAEWINAASLLIAEKITDKQTLERLEAFRSGVAEKGAGKLLETMRTLKNSTAAKLRMALEARAAIEARLGAIPKPAIGKREAGHQLEALRDTKAKALHARSEHGRIMALIRDEKARGEGIGPWERVLAIGMVLAGVEDPWVAGHGTDLIHLANDARGAPSGTALSALTDALPQNVPTDSDIAAINGRMEVLEAELRAHSEADTCRDEMERHVAEARGLEKARDFYAAGMWACERLRERAVTTQSSGLVDTMSTFLRAAGRKEDAYVRARKGATDFGWRRDDRDMPIEILSGGEATLYSAALASAVISARNPSLRILLLEGAELGSEVIRDVLLGCQAMVNAGKIDQVLVATNARIILPGAPWNIVTAG